MATSSGIRYVGRAGQELTAMQWATLHNNALYATVALTWEGDARISTTWLGLDVTGGLPYTYETVVDTPKDPDGPWDQFLQRYRTEDEAVKGHDAVVAMVRIAQNLGGTLTEER